MQWLDVDGARDYLAGGRERKPSRKMVYAMVQAGMRVARIGESGRRMRFCTTWIDEFLIARSSVAIEDRDSAPRIIRAAR